MRDRNKHDHGKYGVYGFHGNTLKGGKDGLTFFEALADRALVLACAVRAAVVICFHRDVKGRENDNEQNQHRQDTG